MKSTKLKALVVEDSIVTQRLISIFLTRMGFEVILIDNGVDALKLLKESHYDIIFLDVIMPEVTGYSVCKFIKASPATKSIPVIMLTSKDGMFDKVKGRMSGADIYLVKPINHKDLVKAVNRFYPVLNGELQISYNKANEIQDSNKTKALSKTKEAIESNAIKKTQSNLRHKTEFPRQSNSKNLRDQNKILSIADTIRKSRIN